MRIADTKASMALLLAGLLVVGGTGTVLIASANPFGFASNASINTTQHHNLTIQVGAVVEGKSIPIIGAEVSVWSSSVNKTNDSIVITFTRVAHATTQSGGNLTFNLSAGQYIVVANYSGLQSIKRVTLDTDVSIVAILHNCHHGEDGRTWACQHNDDQDHDNRGQNQGRVHDGHEDED